MASSPREGVLDVLSALDVLGVRARGVGDEKSVLPQIITDLQIGYVVVVDE